MPSVEMILVDDVPTDGLVQLVVPMLRPGDIEPDTGVVTIDGVAQPAIELSGDYHYNTAYVRNIGEDTWPAGALMAVSWQGDMIEVEMDDLQAEVAALQANLGITDGSDAAPGEVGEYLVIDNMVGIVPPANTPAQVCSIDLPIGCFEIWGACDFTIAAAGADAQAGAPVQPNQLASSISLYPDALPTQDDLIVGTGVMNLIFSPLAVGQRQVLITGQCRSNSIDPITLYLVAAVGSANANVKGYISARRVR